MEQLPADNVLKREQGYIPTGDGPRLFYYQLGAGPDVVIFSSGSWLEADAGPLVKPGRTLILFDSRGRGGSDPVEDSSQLPAGYEVEEFEAVRRFVDAEKVAVLGWSMHGVTAARYAARYPGRVTRLVMMCPGYIRSEAPYLDMEALRQKATGRIDPAALQRLEDLKQQGFDTAQPEAYCKEHQRTYVVRQMGRPEALADMKSNPCERENEWPRNTIAFFEKLGFPGAYDWRQVAASVRAPTLVIHGSEDLIPSGSSAEWAETIPNAELVVIEGAGHYPHLEAPESFFAAVDRFLES
jgi:pimeloyl-ACP methyl ester carboxylesterase